MPKLPQAEPDMVEHPPHYTHGEVECIDAIKSALGNDGFRSYLKGQIIKYLWRADHKGSKVQDLKKAEFYLTRLIEEEDGVKSESNS